MEMPRAHLLSMLNKIRTGVPQDLVEEMVFIVDMRETHSQRQLELPRVGRESNRLNMTSFLNWANRGTGGEERGGTDETERGPREETTKREREQREGVARMAGFYKNQKLGERKQNPWAREM